MGNILDKLRGASDKIDTAKEIIGRGLEEAGGGIFGWVKDKASSGHHALLDHVPLYRAADGIVHDIKHEAIEIKDELVEDGITPTNVFTSVGSGIFDVTASSTIRLAHGTVDTFIDPVFGGSETIRFDALDQDSREYIQAIFGTGADAPIEYEDVRIVIGNVSTDVGMAEHVVGNTIYLPEEFVTVDASGNYVVDKNKLFTFGHEFGHVWQNQNGGGDYAHHALIDQGIAAVFEGDRNHAYHGHEGLASGTLFEDLGPEEQADVIGHIGADLHASGTTTVTDSHLVDAHDTIKKGEGAP